MLDQDDERPVAALIPATEFAQEDDSQPRDDAHRRGDDRARTWRDELPRWLATLDAPRTRREYEKAVSYFFATPGVPEPLLEISFDLLLAYRGSLALRAQRQPLGQHGVVRDPSTNDTALHQPAVSAALPLGRDDPTDEANDQPYQAQLAPGPLAPATVNIRLTALRSFLGHCSTWGLTPHLSGERMRAALRRLRIERRRPYQVLAEPEWEAFLQAARAPEGDHAAPRQTASGATRPARDTHRSPVDDVASRQDPGPWGVPKSARQRASVAVTAPSHVDFGQGEVTVTDVAPAITTSQTHSGSRERTMHKVARSRAGLTGARTALRDQALLALALATGLRAIELCGLDVADITREWNAGQEEWWLVLPDAKTKGQRGGRTLPLASPLVGLLHEYLASTGRQWARAGDRRSPLFLSLRHRQPNTAEGPKAGVEIGGRLSTDQVRRIVDRVETRWQAEQSGGDGADDSGRADPKGARRISPHALRHSTAVALLEGNVTSGRPPASVEHVRGWLGHFDIRTTQGYLAHLEARRHRRPFALAPSGLSSPGVLDPQEKVATSSDVTGGTSQTGTRPEESTTTGLTQD